VERALKKLEGVHEVNVNLATGKATIKYDNNITRVSNIKEAIRRAGYEPLEVEVDSNIDKDKEAKDKEIKGLKKRLIIATIFTIPLFYMTF